MHDAAADHKISWLRGKRFFCSAIFIERCAVPVAGCKYEEMDWRRVHMHNDPKAVRTAGGGRGDPSIKIYYLPVGAQAQTRWMKIRVHRSAKRCARVLLHPAGAPEGTFSPQNLLRFARIYLFILVDFFFFYIFIRFISVLTRSTTNTAYIFRRAGIHKSMVDSRHEIRPPIIYRILKRA